MIATRETPKLNTITLSGDLMLAALIAVHYSNSTRDCPVPGFASFDQRAFATGFQIGSDMWYASGNSQTRVWNGSRWVTATDDEDAFEVGEKVAGITVTRHIEQRNGGEEQEVWWFPLESLKHVELTIEGIRFK